MYQENSGTIFFHFFTDKPRKFSNSYKDFGLFWIILIALFQ